jgi:pimeloyl-ACP methyl ester carboxylesterase
MVGMLTSIAHLAERSVRYLEAGAGQPLLLLHAFPLSADQWLPQLAQVPAGYRVIAPDLRGFRGSGPPSDAPGLDRVTMDGYAADVLALMTHLGIDSAVIGGLSMGGYVALALFGLAPARVAGLVLANTRATADAPDGRAGREKTIALVEREGPAALAREMVTKLLGATTLAQQPDLADVVGHMIRMNSTEGIVAALRAMRDRPDRTSLLASIRCPTTVIAGEEDVIIPVAEAEALQHAIPGARLVVLPRTGHLSNLEGDDAGSRFFAAAS